VFICEDNPDDRANKGEWRQSYEQKFNAMQDGPCNCQLRIIVIPIQIFALHSCKSNKYDYNNRTQRKKQIADCLNPHLTSFSKLEVDSFQFLRDTLEIQLIHTRLLYGFS